LSSILIITGIAMSFIFPFAQSGEAIVSLVISICFGFCLTYALISIRKRDVSRHRKWMIRAIAAGFAPATMRIFFAVILTNGDASAREVFSMTLWMGLITNLLLAELWIRFKWSKNVYLPAISEASS